jgi:5'-phosphate synthase pdxT subunit
VIGVLALQGGFSAHLRALRAIGFDAREVRYAADLDAIDGLVLPGGESTALLKLIAAGSLAAPLSAFAAAGRPILATCAGLVLAARTVHDPDQESFGWLPVTVRRNAWGRQVDSFRAQADEGAPLVFIRAPRIADAGGAEVLLRYRGEPVLVRSGRIFGATFHPELTGDATVHRLALGDP